ncbi:MAG: efflux RND transporter periplasmic adaptor subunit [Candidatus Oceanisphaera merdipullorum]|nr:efflux RND transporter periplasmic adaptor subunit [Candidatus Oceanisphaera merdipullorum]
MTIFQGLSRLMPAATAAAILLSACGKTEQIPQQTTASVEVVAVQPRVLTLESELPGRIEPVRAAEVRARVAGIVLKRQFQEGATVKAGDVLFQIDPAPLKTALARAESELAKAEAALFDARNVVKRYKPLVEIEAVSRQDFDAAQAALKSAQAARQSALADVETAQLNLGYATVTAPISGRIGRALVTEGALVGQNETTPMTLIQQLDPVYADFKQSVGDMLRLREALSAGQLTQQGSSAAISISIDGTDQKRDGELLFSDITVDRGTGQVSMRGQFQNKDGFLLPGMYVRVHTSQGTDPNAILVPQRAVQRGADSKASVLVVGKNDIVESRTVHTGSMHGSEWHILNGLESGERVIVGGAESAQPGAKVHVTTADNSPQPKPTSTLTRQ